MKKPSWYVTPSIGIGAPLILLGLTFIVFQSGVAGIIVGCISLGFAVLVAAVSAYSAVRMHQLRKAGASTPWA